MRLIDDVFGSLLLVDLVALNDQGSTVLNAEAIENGGPQDFSQYEDLMQRSSFIGISEAVENASYAQSSTPAPNTPSGYTIEVQADVVNQSITLYPAFQLLNATQQGQALIHEGVHLATGLSDQALGQAVSGNVFPMTLAVTCSPKSAQS